MKKPALSDFNLTPELLKLNEKQHELYQKKLEEYIASKKEKSKTILICFILASLLALIMILTTESLFWEISFGLLSVMDVVTGFYYFQTKECSIWNVDMDIRMKINEEVIDQEIDKNVNKYETALKEYEEKKFCINEYSLVKTKMSVLETDIGIQWLVFSNKHLANPRSFPTLDLPDHSNLEFEDYYYQLIEKQSSKIPKPKKHLNITEDMFFYYPCSDLFLAVKGKREGDRVQCGFGTYEILEVRNLDME